MYTMCFIFEVALVFAFMVKVSKELKKPKARVLGAGELLAETGVHVL